MKRPLKDKMMFYANRWRCYPRKPPAGNGRRAADVHFPLAETNFDPPLFYPTDIRIRQSPLAVMDIKLAFQVLYRTLNALGYRVNTCPAEKARVLFEWGPSGLGELGNETILIMEHGWLPRWSYQISAGGCNARGHYARYDPAPLTAEQKSRTLRYLDLMLRMFRQTLIPDKVEGLKQNLKDPFILFPFQLASDFNLKYSDSPFTSCYTGAGDGNVRFAQACIDYLEAADLPLPVVFKQHPADRTRGLRDKLSVKNPRNRILGHRDAGSSHEIFATGLCRLVIGVNSNTVHEAAVWDVPAICLGTLLWDAQTQPRPFPGELKAAASLAGASFRDQPSMLSYAHHVIRHQWFLSDFQNPLIVEEIMRTSGGCEAQAVRDKYSLSG